MNKKIIEDLLEKGQREVEAMRKQQEEKEVAENIKIATQRSENLTNAQVRFMRYLQEIHKVQEDEALEISHLCVELYVKNDREPATDWTASSYVLDMPGLAPIQMNFSTKNRDIVFTVPKICRGEEGEIFYSYSNRNNAIGLTERLELLDLEIAMYHAKQCFDEAQKLLEEDEQAKKLKPEPEYVPVDSVGEPTQEVKVIGDLVEIVVSRVMEKLQEK